MDQTEGSNSVDLNKVCYFLVTGASRGIGQTMAIECSKRFKPGSVVLLLARSASGLEETKSKILEYNSKITVITCSIDLSAPTKEELHDVISKSLTNVNKDMFELAYVIHNIGTLGDTTKKTSELDDQDIWQNYFSKNVFSVGVLNTQFMKIFKENKKLVVNITSKAAISPIRSFGLYCSGKAARELYFRVLAEEHTDVVVLNYSPGPVETNMIDDVVQNTNDSEIRDYFMELRTDKHILSTLETTEKLLNLLKKGHFQSGSHIDYFD